MTVKKGPDKETSLKRLLAWKKLIGGIPKKHLDMCDWVDRDAPAGCGTVACAAGHAAMHKPFVKAGLYIDQDYCPTYDHADGPYYGSAAVQHFFGISEEQAEFICDVEAYTHDVYRKRDVKPAVVAQHIQQVIDEIEEGKK